MLVLRDELPSDFDVTAEIVKAAFGSDSVPGLVRAMRTSSAWRGLSFLAACDDQAIGHVAFTRGWLDAPSKLIEVLILSPLSVLPEWQRKGVGRFLVEESLKRLESRYEPLVFLEGNPLFYSRLGFLKGTEHGFSSPSSRIPDAAFQFRKLPAYDPSKTGRLVYPDVFWEMDSVGLRP